MAKTNPNGANQYLVDPRQALFLNYYLNPKSETFSNILQSALRAGYEQNYAENLSGQMPEWFKEKLGKLNMLSKAERNLDKMLDLKEDTEGKLRVKADITKFVAETIGRKDYGKKEDDKETTYNIVVFNDEQLKSAAEEYLRSRTVGKREPLGISDINK